VLSELYPNILKSGYSIFGLIQKDFYLKTTVGIIMLHSEWN